MKEKHRRLLLGVATGHLILVALGAGGVSLRALGPLARPIELYSALSGASSSFGFFTPGVTDQLEASFEIIDGQGNKTIVSLETGRSHEADLRVGDIIDTFGKDAEDPEGLRRALSASLAGEMFGRNPEAREVIVRLSLFESISMEEFRRGERPPSRPIYEARFVRKPKHAE